jgi:macrodomain Ter protein organizer (MatP/YcbG family)
MTAFSQPLVGNRSAVPAAEQMRRKPQRLSVTVSWALWQRLQKQADWEGRSLSNYAAHILENGCRD